MEQTGATLSMLGDGVYKGNSNHSGTLLKIHDNSFTSGVSKIVQDPLVNPRFGFGCWFDPAAKNGVAHCVRPANGVFAGILARNPAIASGQPAANSEILPYNKSTLVSEGYVVYKKGFNAATAAEDQTFADVTVGMKLFVNTANGRPRFAAAGATVAGFVEVPVRIVRMNPDDKSWTVKVEA